MTKNARTKDERFLICLYEEGLKLHNDPEAIFDRYVVGGLVGLQAIAVDTICVLLMKANFIKRYEGNEISLSPHGLKLVKSLLDL